MDDCIIDLRKAGGEEFDAYFGKLSCGQRKNFVRQRREEIEHLMNADILNALCSYGCFNALLPLIKTGDARADEMIIRFYSPDSFRPITVPTVSEEKEIVKYAATRLKVAKFMREETLLFSGFIRKRVPFRLMMYEYATPEVADYLFDWINRRHLPMIPSSGVFLFGKASQQVIHDYLMKVGCFSGKVNVSYQMLKNLALRTDIEAEDKHELLLLAVNQMQVRTMVIHQLRTEGLLDF